MSDFGVYRSGYVALIGRPNVGKSTLMNRMLGEKLSIVTEKPQTTRNRILGIKTTEHFQALFLDTPGIHTAKHRLNEIMLNTALSALEDADLILFLVEPVLEVNEEDQLICHKLKRVKTPVILIINKIDTIRKENLLSLIREYSSLLTFKEVIPISALTGDGVADLEVMIPSFLPEGPRYYPGENLTDLSERFIISEMIREKIIQQTHNEIPYAAAVVVEAVRKREGADLVDVEAVIYIEKESQKGILIGKQGKRLKEIGTMVRPEIEGLLNSRVYLKLWVKVHKAWRDHSGMLKELGFE